MTKNKINKLEQAFLVVHRLQTGAQGAEYAKYESMLMGTEIKASEELNGLKFRIKILSCCPVYGERIIKLIKIYFKDKNYNELCVSTRDLLRTLIAMMPLKANALNLLDYDATPVIKARFELIIASFIQ